MERRRLYWENIDHILGRLFELDEHKPNYEPKKSDSVAARAIRLGIDPWELLLRLFMKNNGSNRNLEIQKLGTQATTKQPKNNNKSTNVSCIMFMCLINNQIHDLNIT